MAQGDRLSWAMRVPRGLSRLLHGLPASPRDTSPNPMGRLGASTYFRSRILPLSKLRAGKHLDDFENLGERIYDLTSDYFKQTYWALRRGLDCDNFPIQFYCSDPTIPWELMRPVPPSDARDLKPTRILALSHPVARWLLDYESNITPNLTDGAVVAVAATSPGYDAPNGKPYPPAPAIAEVVRELKGMAPGEVIELPALHATILDLFLGKLKTTPAGDPIKRPIGSSTWAGTASTTTSTRTTPASY
jgi:hypothetical protein